MGSFSKNVWAQLKNMTADKFIRAALRDGFALDEKVKTERIYRHPDGRRFSIHYHKGSNTLGREILNLLLKDVEWSEKDLHRLKLTK